MNNEEPLHVVLLHGYGANAQDLEAIGHAWQNLAPELNLKCYAFDAPLPCPGNPFGYAWYPLESTDAAYLRQGLDQAVPVIQEFFDGISSNRIVVAGFSQGGNVALDTALSDERVCGAIVYSGYFTMPRVNPVHTPPVLWVHGSADQIVPHAAMVEAKHMLEQYGCDIRTVTRLNLGHTIDEQGLHEGLEFLRCLR